MSCQMSTRGSQGLGILLNLLLNINDHVQSATMTENFREKQVSPGGSQGLEIVLEHSLQHLHVRIQM